METIDVTKFIQYRVFVAVVETGGISSAAKLMNYSPSAVSKRLNALEDSIKVRLLERSNRKVKITDEGRIFYKHCKDILTAVSEAENNLRTTNEMISGKLTITLSKSLARSDIFDLLAKFSQRYPAIRYHFELTDEVQDLIETNIDFAFRLGHVHDSTRLVALPLFDVQLIFCATPQYLQRNGHPETFAELSEHQLIVLSPYYYSDVMRKFFKNEKIDIDKKNNHSTNDIEAVYQAVNSHQCIGMMLDVSVRGEIEANTLVNVFYNKQKPPSKRLYLLYKKNHQMSEKHNTFKQFVRNELQ